MADILHEELIALSLPVSRSYHIIQYILWTGIGIELFGGMFGFLVLVDILRNLYFCLVVYK